MLMKLEVPSGSGIDTLVGWRLHMTAFDCGKWPRAISGENKNFRAV